MRSRLLPVGAVVALGVLAPAALADPSVSAFGTGSVPVRPANPRSDASIRAAIDLARQAAIPLALADARKTAQLLADGASLTLGAITSVAEQGPNQGFVVVGPIGVVAPFGGNFCHVVKQPIFGKVGGKRRVIRRVRTRRCYFPPVVGLTVQVTFAATPKA